MRTERGFVLVLCLLMLLMVTLLGVAGIQTGTFGTMIAGNGLDGHKAFWIAESGLQDSKEKLNQAAGVPEFLNMTSYLNSNIAYGGGVYKVTAVVDPSFTNRVLVTSTATIEGRGKRVVQATFIKLNAQPKSWSAIAANGSVDTIGNFAADGRDHDEDGITALSGTGSYGVSTKQTLNLGGSSSIGGFDIAPPNKGFDPSVVQQNASWPAMTSPDNALGLPEGTLKAMAQANGTYYTNVNMVPAGPISGVTFVEGDFATADGEGVLVVTGTLGNFHGNFKGIIIANCVNKANGNSQIVGTMITLTTASADVLNGTCDVLFSRARIKNTLKQVAGVKIVAWKEIKN